MRKMRTRSWLRPLALVFCSVLLAACAPGGGQGDSLTSSGAGTSLPQSGTAAAEPSSASSILAGEETAVDIIKDTQFAKGFGAEWAYGFMYSEDTMLRKGSVLAYQDIRPYTINLIPFGDAEENSEDDIYWEFEEGAHKNYVDEFGQQVAELHEHRLCVTGQVVENTDDCLMVEQYNNYGLSEGGAGWNTTLVKRVSTDKNGTIGFYYNTQNEVRNAAYAYSAEFAEDTWPHLLFHQNFKSDYDLADFSRIEVQFDLLVQQADQLSGWPDDAPEVPTPKSPSEASLQGYFFCRSKSDPGVGFFVGLNLFSTRSENQALHVSADQHGNAFYRDGTAQYGGPVEIGQPTTIQYELKEMINDALYQFGKRNSPLKGTAADNYTLSFFQIGWENMGHWECAHELSNLSVTGYSPS